MKLNITKEQFIALILLTVIFLFIFYCSIVNKSSDQKAYNEVIATMSMEKANQFFRDYPDSRLKDILVDQIVEWCKQEKTEECYRMILEAIPKDHATYRALQIYYNEQFKSDK